MSIKYQRSGRRTPKTKRLQVMLPEEEAQWVEDLCLSLGISTSLGMKKVYVKYFGSGSKASKIKKFKHNKYSKK